MSQPLFSKPTFLFKFWLAVSVCLLVLGGLSLPESWRAGGLLIITALVVNPWAFAFLVSKIRREDPLHLRVIFTWLALIVASYVFGSQMHREATEKVEAAKIAQQNAAKVLADQRAAEAQQRRLAIEQEFATGKDAILVNFDTAIASRDAAAAQKVNDRYAAVIRDPSFVQRSARLTELKESLKKESDIKSLLEKSKSLAVKDYAGAVAVYRQLVALDPASKSYAASLARFEKAKAVEDAAARKSAEELAARETRKKNINDQFGGWDGSHILLEMVIKETMNDPDSYDHVSTTYTDKGDFIRVHTIFRGKNAFGALIRDSVTADFTISGNFIRVIGE